MSPLPRQSRPATLAVALITALIGAILLVLPQPTPAHADSSGGGGDYVPLAATGRLVDTRNGTGIAGTAPLGEKAPKSFPVLGKGGVPTAGVRAVLVDVTIVAPTAHTWFRLWADGAEMPAGMSMVQAIVGENTSNTAVVPVGANGAISIYNNTGTAHAVIDVQGYFTSATSSSGTGGFIPITQTRALDTRTTGGSIAAGASRAVTLSTGGVPTTATAAFANVTVIGATAGGSVVLSASGTTTGGAFNYAVGTSATGTSIKLNAGKATITNSGTTAIDVVLDLQGYWSPTSSLGAGYREAVGRVIDTRTTAGGGAIPARSSRDIAVGGSNGLPVRSLAGVLLNFTPVQGADTGWLSAWPTGTTRPTPTVANFPAATTRAELAIVKPGTNGKVSVYNGSDAPLDLVVDLEGYFLDPLTPVAIDANSATAIVQASAITTGAPRHLEFSYVNNSGQLVHGDIPDPDLVNSVDTATIQTLSGGEAFTGTPAVAEQANGNLFIAGHHTESNVWAKTETNKTGSVWPAAWTKLGGSIRSHAAVGRFSDTRLVLFGVDADGALWSSSQSAANGAFDAWTNLGDVDLTGTPVVVTNPTGVVQIVARNLTGNIVTATYSTAGALSAWTSLGNPGAALDATGVPAVAVGPTLIRVFVRTPAGDIATQQQNVGGTWPATWTTIAGVSAGGPPTAVVHPVNGTYQVFTRTTDGHFQWASELTRNSATWTTWATFESQDGSPLISDPTAFSWIGSAQKFGVVYRIGNDINQIASLTNTTPPPAAAARSSARAQATEKDTLPEFSTYTATK